LSVVDCFDALTSDRPYRPRLSDDEALKILVERRGNMYDPLIVDTFVRVHKEIAPPPLPAVAGHALSEITGPRLAPLAHPQLEGIAASADEMTTLFELAQAVGGQAGIGPTGDVVVKHLRRLIPFAQSALFLYDASTDELVAQHAVGDVSSAIKGVRISLGQRLSGWVAANRQIILNSDPALDLGDAARAVEPRLRSSISAPLIADNELVGVLTLYSTVHGAFSDKHRRIIGIVAEQISRALRATEAFDHSAKRDPVTGLPNLKQLERLVEATSGTNVAARKRIALLLIDVVHLKEINGQCGRDAGDATLRHVVKYARARLRAADVLFRYGNDEFVALLNDATLDTAQALALQIREAIRSHRLTSEQGDVITVDVKVTPLIADGGSFDDHIESARRTAHDKASEPQRVH
jgi:diguanylate cyclase (GGDEF)-like protein